MLLLRLFHYVVRLFHDGVRSFHDFMGLFRLIAEEVTQGLLHV